MAHPLLLTANTGAGTTSALLERVTFCFGPDSLVDVFFVVGEVDGSTTSSIVNHSWMHPSPLTTTFSRCITPCLLFVVEGLIRLEVIE